MRSAMASRESTVEGELHPAFGAELIHQDARAGKAGDVFEEEGGPTGVLCALVQLGGAVGDLGHLEVGRYGEGDALEFVRAFELLDPVAQVGVSHVIPW